MSIRNQVGFATKLLSNTKYLREVSVEGKECSQFFRRLTFYNLYVSQIIRTGNCVSLLSNPLFITVQSFWNPHHFEDITKYVFWTFNKSFLWMLTEQIPNLRQAVITQSVQLLKNSPDPYGQELFPDADEELRWCLVKNASMQKSGKFTAMYQLDQKNRSLILTALEKKLPLLSNTSQISEVDPVITQAPVFLEFLNTFNGQTAEELLNIIKGKSLEAGLEYDIFSPVQQLENGKNPYGFNGSVAAVLDFFYQYNYFKFGYSLSQIFNAYLVFSGNKIGKLSTFLSAFRENTQYKKYFKKLEALKINKLR